MDELIKELKENQKVNKEKGLPNIVAIDYIIERLKEINILWEYIRGEVKWNIETLINENYMENDKQFKKIESLTDKDIDNITNLVYNTDWLWDDLNESTNNAINNEIKYYINKK